MKQLAHGLLILFIVLITSCSSPDATKLNVGSNQWPGYESLYLARELGFFESESIKLIELASATDVMTAFKLGQLDVAALTLDEVISLTPDVPDAVVFLVMDISHGADKLIADSDITRVAELAGQRLGYEKTALGAFFLEEFLKKTGLSADDLVLSTLTVDQHENKMRMDDVDAVITFEPTASRLLSLGYNEIFNSSQIPGKIMDVLVTTQTVIDEKSHLINALVTSHWRALDHMQSNNSDAMQLISRRLRVSPEQVSESYHGLILPNRSENQALLNNNLKVVAMTLNKLMIQYQLIDEMVNVEQLTTEQFVQ